MIGNTEDNMAIEELRRLAKLYNPEKIIIDKLTLAVESNLKTTEPDFELIHALRVVLGYFTPYDHEKKIY